MTDLVAWLRQQLDTDERQALRVIHWPDDQCKPAGRAFLFRHDEWVRRHVSEDSGDQVVRTATEHEGQLPEDWESGRPVPEGWIGTHEVAHISSVPGSDYAAQWLGDFIVNNDPARVLRQVQAHRAILADLAAVIEDDEGHNYFSDGHAGLDVAKRTLRLLASIYSDGDGWQEEWAA